MADDTHTGPDDDLRAFEREVLGAPTIPPPAVTAAATTVRRVVADLHRRAAPPPVRVLEALFARFDTPVLRALVSLDVPDLLTEPTSVTSLAAATGTDVDRLRRLLRYAAGRRFVRLDDDVVHPTGVTRALRRDAAAPWRGWVLFAGGDGFGDAWRRLEDGLRPGAPPAFDLATGTDFFTHTTTVDPDAGAVFDQAMEAGATLQGIALAHVLDWSDVTSVCDVGGGTGATLRVLQRYQPHLAATLFDLPEVVARSDFGSTADDTTRDVVGGSFFDAVPSGHDRHLLLAIVHDWDDQRAVDLLATVREAMPHGGELVVVENVLSARPRDDVATASDLLMLVLATGRERTEDEYDQLAGAAGLVVTGRHALPTGATAFVLRRA